MFEKFELAFGPHNYTVSEVMDRRLSGQFYADHDSEMFEEWSLKTLKTLKNCPLEVLLIQVIATYLTYIMGKFACKVQIQNFSFSAPICLVVPLASTLIMSACGSRAKDPCAFNGLMPQYLFFDCPAVGDFWHYIYQEQMWLWALWFLSQVWITRHIWYPKSPRLAATERMFAAPYYSGLFIDQSMAMNRRRDGEDDIVLHGDDLVMADVKDKDKGESNLKCTSSFGKKL